MQKTIAAVIAALLLTLPAMAAEKKKAPDAAAATAPADAPAVALTPEQEEAAADAKLEEINKLAKKKNCKEVVMYREVLPFFGKETTIEASKQITVEYEQEDLKSGKAEILHTQSKCTELLGNFFVNCVTITALCYHEAPQNVGSGEKLSEQNKKQAEKKSAAKKSAQKPAAAGTTAIKAKADPQ